METCFLLGRRDVRDDTYPPDGIITNRQTITRENVDINTNSKNTESSSGSSAYSAVIANSGISPVQVTAGSTRKAAVLVVEPPIDSPSNHVRKKQPPPRAAPSPLDYHRNHVIDFVSFHYQVHLVG